MLEFCQHRKMKMSKNSTNRSSQKCFEIKAIGSFATVSCGKNVDVCKCHFDQKNPYAWHSALLLSNAWYTMMWMVKMFKADFILVSTECARPSYFIRVLLLLAVPFDLDRKIHLLFHVFCVCETQPTVAQTHTFLVIWMYSVGACVWVPSYMKGGFSIQIVYFVPSYLTPNKHIV